MMVPVGPEAAYQLTGESIDQHWGVNTRFVMLASPSNPTGSMLSQERLRSIHNKVRQNDGVLVVDEIYQGLHFDNLDVVSGIPLGDDVIVVNSFSKYFCMTGWRLGWMVVPEVAVPTIEKLAQNLFICPSTLAQHAALAAFEPETIEVLEGYRRDFEVRRNLVVNELQEAGFGVDHNPEGAFYVYARIPSVFASAEQMCRELLEEFHVALTPGTDFGEWQADQHVRVSFAQSLERLQTACHRIKTAVARH